MSEGPRVRTNVFRPSALNPAIYAYLNKEFKNAFKRVICCMSISQINEMEREAMFDEISTTSRSYQRNMDRIHGGLDVPPTPGFISRTPSATPDTTNWPLIQGHTSLMIPGGGSSRKPSAQSTATGGETTSEEIPLQPTTRPGRVNGNEAKHSRNLLRP